MPDKTTHMLPFWSRGYDYLDAIDKIVGTKRRRVRTGEIATQLEVTPASVSVMLQRLANAGLLDRRSHHGVRLTRDGCKQLAAWRERNRRRDAYFRDLDRARRASTRS